MDTVIVSGLHTCKPQNSPSVGQVKAFIAEDRGNWTKLRNPDRKKGEIGAFYRVLKADQTNYKDDHGNISFNLELEETEAPAQQAPPPQQHVAPPPQGYPPANGNGTPAALPAPRAMDTVEQHVMRSANLYNVCLSVAATVIRDCGQRKGLEFAPEDIRQIATTLYIQAKDNGYIAHMGDKEPQIKKAPF